MTKSKPRKLQNAFAQMKPKKKVSREKSLTKPAMLVKSKAKKSAPELPKGKGLHARNLHRDGYDFEQLILASPSLEKYVRANPYGNQSIDFGDANAVKSLNLALLRRHYHIKYWDIPEGYLCPPIPGRADYIHYLADLLKVVKSTDGKLKPIRVLDIGTGANGIYPIIGIQAYGWQFVASDIDPTSLENVTEIIRKNKELRDQLELRLQSNPIQIFQGVIREGEYFDVTMCNPPFHSSLAEAQAGSQRKLKNLGKNRSQKGHTVAKDSKGSSLNFGGQKAELWCEGGEQRFILDMIRESQSFSNQCTWFTTLVSKKETLAGCYAALKQAHAKTVKTIEMVQGNKITRVLAWRFK